MPAFCLNGPNLLFRRLPTVRHLLGLAMFLFAPPGAAETGRYDPLVEDEFFFHLRGEAREYLVTPRFFSSTEFALLSSGNDIPRALAHQDPPDWKVRAQAYRAGEFVQEIYLMPKAGWPREDDPGFYRALSLGSFSDLDYEFFPKQVLVKVIVEKTDGRYAGPRPKMRFVVRTSPIP